ncbi:serine hydrolase [Asanoa sp. NPDC049518]|uniref:serine hydrolase n=1 Tax=unclassified Asanoa TaxID=2685164 RepID=UPI003411FFE9
MSTSHRRRRDHRATTVIALIGVLAVVGFAGARFWPGSPFASRSAARTRIAPQAVATSRVPESAPKTGLSPLPVKATEIRISHSGWYSWALLDTRTGELSGPTDRTALSTTASLIKSWIGADFLHRTAERGQRPTDEEAEQLETMIRDSDNEAADALFDAVGREDSIRRLISTCDLHESMAASDGGWSGTLMSPADITRLGACIADGRAAGPVWTDYLLDQLRAVRDDGDFGIRKAFPEDQQRTIATKNGWVDREEEQEYHVSCMAIGTGWVVGAMARYEIEKGPAYGAEICKLVGAQLRKAAGG